METNITAIPAILDDKSSGQACHVCSHPVASSHFGSISCLACAAFFRRTVALELEFICKKNGKCRIYYEYRMSCRGCRFVKCLHAGMKRKHVLKRRSNGDSKEAMIFDVDAPTTILYNASSGASPEMMPSSSGLSSCPSYSLQSSSMSASPSNLPRFDMQDQLSTSSSEANLTIGSMKEQALTLGISGSDLLTHYVNELRKAMDRRCIMFTDDPFRAMAGSYKSVPYSLESSHPHTIKGQVEGQKFDHLLAFEYCQGCPGYEQLTTEERIVFFRTATMSFCILDIAWITSQATKLEDKVILYTDGSVSSVQDLSHGWEDEVGMNREEKSRLFLDVIQRFYFAIVQPFFEYKVDQVEYAALKAFCVWKMGYCDYTQHMRAIAKEHEKGLLIGLNAYYENRENKAERMGNIILLMGSIFEVYQTMILTYHSVDLFRLFKLDHISKHLLSS